MTRSSSARTPKARFPITSLEGSLFDWCLCRHSNTTSRCMSFQIRVPADRSLMLRHIICSFDVRHMPQGCSTWPSIWEAGLENWPADGEIDIIEGANDRTPNEITLHATSGCNVPQTREQTGNTLGTDCNTPEPDSVGCGVGDTNDNSYGPAFNDNGGGWYALERTDSFIKVWFWPRNVKPPSDVVACGSQVNTDTWVSRFSRRS